MSDKLKKYIQQSKSKFDLETPRPDLFDKIMDNVGINQKIELRPGIKVQRNYKLISIAAAITLLVVCVYYFYFEDFKNNDVSLKIASEYIQENQNDAKRKTEIKTLPNFSTEQKNTAEIHQTNIPNSTTESTKFESKPLNNNPKMIQLKNNSDLAVRHVDEMQIQNSDPVYISFDSLTISTADAVQFKNTDEILNQKLEEESFNMLPVMTGVLTMQEGARLISIASIKEEITLNSKAKNSKIETIDSENSGEDISLKTTIKRGFFGFLSRNAKKWTGNTLDFKNDKTNDHPILAVHYKDEKFEFSKVFKLGNYGD